MPYRRDLLASTESVMAERIDLLETSALWSEEYESTAFKMLVPLAGYVYVRTRAGVDLVDSASALTMLPNAPYQMRKPVLQSSIVLTVRDETLSERFVNGNGSQCIAIDSRCLGGIHRLATQESDSLGSEERLISALHALQGLEIAQPSRVRHAHNVAQERVSLRAREYLVERFQENFSLSDAARFACSSPFHLSRLFRSRYGVTLFAYRERLRMAAALRALTVTRGDLGTLALDLGYSSHSHFSAAFRRAMGCTPSRWVS